MLKLNAGKERLGILIVGVFYVQHIFACFWVIIGEEETMSRGGWYTPAMVDRGELLTYIQSYYFVVTTMTTVGYGDMTITTLGEQMFCCVLMMVGVFIFSSISGSLASILGSMDTNNAEVSEKLMFLNRLQA